MKFVDLRSLPQNQYLSKFLASKYLSMSMHQFEEFISEHNIQTFQIDKFGEKYRISDLVAVLAALEEGSEIPEEILVTESTDDGIESEINENGKDLIYSFSTKVSNIVRKENGFSSVSREQIPLFEKVPLYHKSPDGRFVLYKPANKVLAEERINDYRCPILYFKDDDQESVLDELILKYNEKLTTFLEEKDQEQAQKMMVQIADNAFIYPEVKILRNLAESVKAMVEHYDSEIDPLNILCNVVGLAKGESEHAVNIMNLAIRFGFSNGYATDDIIHISLAALLHDIGKTKLEYDTIHDDGGIPDTPENRKIFETHGTIGAEIISACNFENSSISLGALEHHERLDGSGFPKGKTKLSFYGQLIGMLHFFEAKLEKQNSKRETKPLTILKLLKDEVDQGKYNAQLFKQFAYSLL